MVRRGPRYFLHHRELLGNMATIAYETVREMMAAAVDEPDARPGMVGVIQTFSSSLKWNPHIHAIVTRGVFLCDSNGRWHPIPYVDAHKAELVFRHKLLRFLRDRDLISEERIDLLLSWEHSGFSVHNHTTVYPSDTEGLYRLACYLHRAPVNLSRLRYHPQSGLLIYEPKAGHDVDDSEPANGHRRLDAAPAAMLFCLTKCLTKFQTLRVRRICFNLAVPRTAPPDRNAYLSICRLFP